MLAWLFLFKVTFFGSPLRSGLAFSWSLFGRRFFCRHRPDLRVTIPGLFLVCGVPFFFTWLVTVVHSEEGFPPPAEPRSLRQPAAAM